ncbi:substrate-binding domain-containing protein [Leadbettera azotonutricia]|uniref:Periplasmic sugar-binding protein n=1 Tax=Leadbettera azotonutricia (strain ATCC BAA-888 / DSM 13862 / ZAS-9) TaxID=545695 RepID=F5YA45_LEAAZ|nr:substrate-binding domain-containing protein [Leadbettera azotonutricia]AEF80169.1 periplasmic sugar-binding protein [Leadbettera azotonutricia ZAS-9]
MKLLKMSVIAALVMLMAAGSVFASGGSQSSGAKKIKIYLITMDQMDAHWLSVDAGAKAAIAELGADKFEYHFDSPEKKDDAAQINKVNNAAANKADYILLAANSADAINGAIQEASKAGVKFIYVDSPATWSGALATIATDNKAAGKTAGEELLKTLNAAGTSSGSIGIVNVNPSTDSAVAREAGFREAFAGKGFTLLPTQYGEGDPVKSQEIAANYITQGVVGIFGTNEGSTVGVANAIKGSKVLGIGFDKGGSVLDQIEQGVLVATMAQNPETMGSLGVKNAYTDSTGGTIAQKSVDSGATVVNKANLAKFR